jgi:hypothetical protein
MFLFSVEFALCKIICKAVQCWVIFCFTNITFRSRLLRLLQFSREITYCILLITWINTTCSSGLLTGLVRYFLMIFICRLLYITFIFTAVHLIYENGNRSQPELKVVCLLKMGFIYVGMADEIFSHCVKFSATLLTDPPQSVYVWHILLSQMW